MIAALVGKFVASNQHTHYYHPSGPQQGSKEEGTLLWAVHLASQGGTADLVIRENIRERRREGGRKDFGEGIGATALVVTALVVTVLGDVIGNGQTGMGPRTGSVDWQGRPVAGGFAGNNVSRTYGSPNSGNRRNSAFKKLSEEEMQDKIRWKVCFRCVERFFPGHVCKNKQLHILLLGDEEQGEEGACVGEEVEDAEGGTMKLNMSSVAGVTSKRSLKLWGTILGNKGVDVVLGYGWLEELGGMYANFKEKVIRVEING
ncbi:Retrotransposable element Tf2 [Sesbania bispinosa]|nr:Retrotransposable element Tf2 [Sesbania bispinosa]